MALTATLAVDDRWSSGKYSMVIGSITVVHSSSTTYSVGGVAITGADGSSLTTEQMLRRALGFDVEIKQIHCEPLFDGDGTQQEGYVAAVNKSTSKIMLLGGAGATETALDEPNGTALSNGTYVTRFLAIGR